MGNKHESFFRHVWETKFTSDYTKGNYVAIVKIDNHFSSTKTFTYNG
ncbi:DUF5065 family protein [Bacillus toyonensis]|nr:DUF5065 family protein [Bacillus toyonensis]MBJ8067574.1 DUF5065 family protein [Bacillus cereus group sp. N15]HDR7448515.1 DUF5065 family protein [Bacillus toyonensis]